MPLFLISFCNYTGDSFPHLQRRILIVTSDDHPLQPTADVVGCYDIRGAIYSVGRAPALFLFTPESNPSRR